MFASRVPIAPLLNTGTSAPAGPVSHVNTRQVRNPPAAA
jgi:hypothetical protein